jgi:ribosomal-protein-alanine N-acetyltransferase
VRRRDAAPLPVVRCPLQLALCDRLRGLRQRASGGAAVRRADPKGGPVEAPLALETERLRLVACTAELAEALTYDRGEAEDLLGAEIPAGWPTEELAAFLPVYARELASDPALLGYGIWLVLDPLEGTLVGDSGFKGKPADGVVELGYSTAGPYRGRGFAFEAAQALVGWAFSQPGIEKVVAETEPDNAHSIRVLEKLGMRQVAERDGMLRWELRAGS